jgi:hypothetical protein
MLRYALPFVLATVPSVADTVHGVLPLLTIPPIPPITDQMNLPSDVCVDVSLTCVTAHQTVDSAASRSTPATQLPVTYYRDPGYWIFAPTLHR